jgi:hypothetical protein
MLRYLLLEYSKFKEAAVIKKTAKQNTLRFAYDKILLQASFEE